MLTSHLQIAFRNIIKRKGYSMLNIAGLTIGISCCLMFFRSATSYPAIGPATLKDFPEVQKFCRLIDDNLLLSKVTLKKPAGRCFFDASDDRKSQRSVEKSAGLMW